MGATIARCEALSIVPGLDRFQIRSNLKPIEAFELSHFLNANRCPLRLKMLNTLAGR